MEACSTEQWRQNSGGMPPLLKKKKQKLFSEHWTQFGRAKSSKLLLSISLRLAHNKLGDPCTVNNFFLNQTLAQCVFEETQPLPRSQTGFDSTRKKTRFDFRDLWKLHIPWLMRYLVLFFIFLFLFL